MKRVVSSLLFLCIITVLGFVVVGFQTIGFKITLLNVIQICLLCYSAIIFLYFTFKKDVNFNSKYFSLALFLSFSATLIFTNLLAVYITSAISIIVSGVIIVSSLNINPSPATFYYIVLAIIYIIFYGTMFLTYYFDGLKKQFKKFIQHFDRALIYILFFYIVIIFFATFFNILSTFIPVTEEVANQSLINDLFEIPGVKSILFIIIVLIGPIYEEIFFRYILIEKFILKFKIFNINYNISGYKEKFKQIAKILLIAIIPAFLFASVHAIAADSYMAYFRDLIVYFGFSYGISISYIYTRNVYITISLHMLNNYLAILPLIYGV